MANDNLLLYSGVEPGPVECFARQIQAEGQARAAGTAFGTPAAQRLDNIDVSSAR
jgi:hypothetical protein